MIKYISWTIIALIIAALVAWRLGVFEGSKKASAQQSTAQKELPVSIKVLEAESIQKKIKATGSILADESVELTTETAGMITGIYFKEGEQVSKGDLLVRINDADLQAELNKIKQEIELANIQLKRYEKLLDREAVSQSEFDQAKTQVLTLKADSALVVARIQKTTLRAPFSGQVGLRNVSPGAYVSSGTSIATLVNVNQLKVQFSISERFAMEVRNGQEVLFNVSGDEKLRKAKVYAINPQIDQSTRTIQIRAIYDNRKDSLKAGAFANVQVVLSEKDKALQVPAQAVALELGSEKTYVIENGLCTSKKVKTGIRNDSQVEITEGLSVGDSVITSGIAQLKEGLPVKAVSKSPAL
ncbi:MAG: efflux RND transporter periplasmic adaptor subunit [Chitinophagales bacterium]